MLAARVLNRLQTGILYFEGLTTMAMGLLAASAPGWAASVITRAATEEGTLAVVRQLGATWFAVGLVVCLLAHVKDGRTLRWLVVPILAGDVLHAAAVWPWDLFALTHLVPTAIYGVNRLLLMVRAYQFVGGSEFVGGSGPTTPQR